MATSKLESCLLLHISSDEVVSTSQIRYQVRNTEVIGTDIIMVRSGLLVVGVGAKDTSLSKIHFLVN